MTSAGNAEATAYVLRLDLVRAAVGELKSKRIHEAFVAYMCITRSAGIRTPTGAQKVSTGLEGDWSNEGEVANWLAVEGGPPGKPYFRPFVSRGSNAEHFWMNRNLAGSYAPASLRGQVRAMLLDPSGLGYRLPTTSAGEIDAAMIASVLLKDGPVPAWAMAAYLFRNRAFTSTSDFEPTVDDLLEALADHLYLTPNEEGLFDWSPIGVEAPFEKFVDEVAAQ